MLTKKRNSSFRKSLYLKHVVLILLLTLWAATCPTFSPQSVLEFGFTPEFTDVAENIQSSGIYGSTLTEGTIISDVRREPLYPFALLITRSLFQDYTPLAGFQIALLALTFYMWSLFIFHNYGRLPAIFFILLLFAAPVPTFYGSVLYPYAFNVFFLSGSLLSLIGGIQKQSTGYFILSGVLCSLAVYERGIYLFLPLFIFVIFMVIRKKLNITSGNLVLYLGVSMVMLFPWLFYSYNQGVIGMNQMTGYTLGYTYGMHSAQSDNPYAHKYDGYMVEYDDTDQASLAFLEDIILSENLTYTEADSILVSVVIEKIKSNPHQLLYTFVKNTLILPSRLVDVGIRWNSHSEPLDYYLASLSRGSPKLLDLIIFFLGILGLLYLAKRLDLLALLSGAVLIYTFPFITTITIFDPRYRGISDIILLVFAYPGLVVCYNLIQGCIRKTVDQKKRSGELHNDS